MMQILQQERFAQRHHQMHDRRNFLIVTAITGTANSISPRILKDMVMQKFFLVFQFLMGKGHSHGFKSAGSRSSDDVPIRDIVSIQIIQFIIVSPFVFIIRKIQELLIGVVRHTRPISHIRIVFLDLFFREITDPELCLHDIFDVVVFDFIVHIKGACHVVIFNGVLDGQPITVTASLLQKMDRITGAVVFSAACKLQSSETLQIKIFFFAEIDVHNEFSFFLTCCHTIFPATKLRYLWCSLAVTE